MERASNQGLLTGIALSLCGVGCADDDASYDATLRELAGELRVLVDVLGTPDPATPRRLQVELQPGPGATIDQDNLCPVIEADARVNGFKLTQTQKGEYFSSTGGGGLLSGSVGCYPILFELALPDELPAELLTEPTQVQIADASGRVRVEIRSLFTPPRASFISPPGGALVPGSRAQLLVEPTPAVLPPRLTGYYRAEEPAKSFGLGEVTIDEAGISFDVLASASPSRGSVEFPSDRSGPFQGLIDRCEGAATCSAARSVCSDSTLCRTGIAYGGGFDSLLLPASVVAANDD